MDYIKALTLKHELEDLLESLKNVKHTEFVRCEDEKSKSNRFGNQKRRMNIRYINKSKTYISILDDESITTYNRICDLVKELHEAGEMKKAVTVGKHGNLSTSRKNFSYFSFYADLSKSSYWINSYIITSKQYCLHIGADDVIKKDDRPFKYYKDFLESCFKQDIDIEKYAVDEETGKAIVTKLNEMGVGNSLRKIIGEEDDVVDKYIPNCFRLDIHSAYPAGLVATHPEFRPIIEEIYKKKQSAKKGSRAYINAKNTLNEMIGVFGSDRRQYKYAQLRYDAIMWTVDYLKKVTSLLTDKGYNPIMYCTDCIVVQDINNLGIPTDLDIGDGLGQFELEHENMTYLIRSASIYQYGKSLNELPHTTACSLHWYDKVYNKDRDGMPWGVIMAKDKPITWKVVNEYGKVEIIGGKYEKI